METAQLGLPYLEPSRGPYALTVAHTGTLLSQGSQIFSQSVELGPSTQEPNLDLSNTLAPLGQSEDESNSHFDDQVQLWQAIGLKPAPMTIGAITELLGPPESVTHLVYR